MTFTALESSVEGGAPIELYEIRVGSVEYFLTTSEDELVIDGNTYTPTEIERTSIVVGPEERGEVLEVTIPASHPFARQYIANVPGALSTFTIRRFHRFDGDEELAVFYKGVVRTVGFLNDGYLAKVALLPLTGGLSQEIPRFGFQSLCNHVLYDARCKVTPNSFRHTGAVTGVNGNVITVSGLGAMPNAWATAGFVEIGVDFRLVLEHDGSDDVRLLLPFPSSVLGETADVYAGCAHDIATCKDKFDNVSNFGGFAFVPLRNPFSSGLS